MKVIIFDFDGTIANSFQLIAEISHELAKRPGLVSDAEMSQMRTLSLVQVARNFNIPKWKWPYMIHRGKYLMTKRINQVEPFPGIAEILQTLYNERYVLVIVSSNSKKNIERFLVQHGIGNNFDQIYGGVGLYGKARVLRKILRRNNIAATEAMYIGDEIRDVEAAKQVNMPCIAVGWGFNTPEMLAAHAPTIVVRQPKQLLSVIEEWNQV
ncbi:HAD hydrolase-like protein [Candidatus Saccharibacteria bacterium]|nr:HAD hydrolase-like protein [Candidatus Saccharibacteria bacterium]